VVVAITGATGAIYGTTVLDMLRDCEDVETHLLMSPWARRTVEHETSFTTREVEAMADVVHAPGNQASVLSSGSFQTEGMIVAPCSVKTLASIASGVADNLVARAADVCLKERRPLVLLVRETPLNAIHLRNMTTVHEAGATIMPPVPAFYHHPKSIEDLVNQTAQRALDQLRIEVMSASRWDGRLARASHDLADGTGDVPSTRPRPRT
jgi:4-hydroxy-3-polyprenylbenzoate decarboxylase